MKKIVCYGDSNTFGFNTADGSRFDEKTRWTCVLQNILGDEYKIINEGMCDRTGFVNNPKGSVYSAQQHFPEMLSQTGNIDILILAVGTNDLQFQYDIKLSDVEKGLETLLNLAQEKAKKIIIIPPVVLNETVLKGFFSFQFNETSIAKSQEMEEIYKKIANKYNCYYFDINEITPPSDIDGLHYDEKSHKIIAENLSKFIKNIEN